MTTQKRTECSYDETFHTDLKKKLKQHDNQIQYRRAKSMFQHTRVSNSGSIFP